MHDEILLRGGGAQGVIAPGALEAALERCRWGPFHGNGGLVERAAYLLRGIVQDHPFADGNKRTSYEATETFLARNGQYLDADATAIVEFMLAAAQGTHVARIHQWLLQKSKPFSSGRAKEGV